MKQAEVSFRFDDSIGAFRSRGLVLPSQRCGRWSISHYLAEPNVPIPVVSLRNALMMGLAPCTVKLPVPLAITNLTCGKGTLWMSDSPQEVEQHERQLAGATGHVLVGGLGIGLAISILAQNRKVKSITVVEKSRPVIGMVKPTAMDYIHRHAHRGMRVSFVHDDLFRFLRHTGAKFDFAFLDIWAPTSSGVFMTTVLPLRKLARRCVSGEIECWNEAEMLGQFKLSLVTALQTQGIPGGLPLSTYIEKVERMKPKYDPCIPFYKHAVKGRAGLEHVDSYVSALREGEHQNWKPIS